MSAIILSGACARTEVPSTKDAPEIYEYGKLVSYHKLNDRTISSLVKEAARRYDINLDSLSFLDELLGNRIVSYRLVYTTADARGRAINLSGDVAYMVGSTGSVIPLNSVSLFHTAFATNEEHCLDYENYAFLARAVHRALVVHPHYQGFFEGKNVPGHPVTVGELMLKARQAMDCEMAAISVLKQIHGPTLDESYYTENIGISCGAGAALATQYLLEMDSALRPINRKYIRLRSTYCCEGCYSYSDLLSDLTSQSSSDPEEQSEFESFKPIIVMATITGAYDTWKDAPDGNGSTFFKGVDLKKCFSEDFLKFPFIEQKELIGDILEYFRRGELDHYTDMFSRSGFTARNILNPAILGSGGIDFTSTVGKELSRVLSINEAFSSGWEPARPICISHSKGDEFLPYEQAYDIFKAIDGGGTNDLVELQSVDDLDHVKGATYFFIKDLLLSNHPCHDIL